MTSEEIAEKAMRLPPSERASFIQSSLDEPMSDLVLAALLRLVETLERTG